MVIRHQQILTYQETCPEAVRRNNAAYALGQFDSSLNPRDLFEIVDTDDPLKLHPFPRWLRLA